MGHVCRARIGVVAVVALLLAAMTGCSRHDDSTQPSPDAAQHAVALLDALVRGDTGDVTAEFDSTMRESLSADQLAVSWAGYQSMLGAYQSHGDPTQVARGDLTVVSVPLTMANAPGEFRVTFRPDGTVAGLWLLKAGVPIP